jgi:ABC-type sugar transport system permease subunit
MSRTTSTNRSVKFIGLLTIIAGVLMIVAGGVTWALVTSQLKAENITVAAVTPANPGRLAGKPVAGPFTAYAQAAAINHHALDGANGRTYAQLGDDAKKLKAKLAASGLSTEEVAKNPDVLALAATRDSTMNGSFLRASLFTSVVAFGVAALVMGLGLLFALLGFALRKISTSDVVIYAQPSGDVGAGEPVGAKA